MVKIKNSELRQIIQKNELSSSQKGAVDIICLENKIIEDYQFINNEALLFEGGNIHFKNCLFYNCQLNDSVLRSISIIQGCTFIETNLSKMFLEGKIIECTFIKCNFFETELVGIDITDSIFLNCDFSSLYLSHTRIKETNFINNANFNADLINNNLEEGVIWLPTP